MTRARPWLALAVVGTLACSSRRDEVGHGTAVKRPSLDEFCSAYVESLAARQQLCVAPISVRYPEAAEICPQVVAAVSAGHMRYDAGHAGACIDTVRAATCSEASRFPDYSFWTVAYRHVPADSPCLRALVGESTTTCVSGADCAPGLYCNWNLCPGACTPLPKAGLNLRSSYEWYGYTGDRTTNDGWLGFSGCAPGYAPGAFDDVYCHPRVGEGETCGSPPNCPWPCTFYTACLEGLACDPSSSTCVPAPSPVPAISGPPPALPGEPCVRGACAPGLGYCSADGVYTPGVCIPLPGAEEPCGITDYGELVECGRGTRCSGSAGSPLGGFCKVPLEPGEACDPVHDVCRFAPCDTTSGVCSPGPASTCGG